MRNMTVKEIALRFAVDKRVAQNWVRNGHFPNAQLEIVPIFGAVWKVPESDLEDFVRPRAGQPRKEKKAA